MRNIFIYKKRDTFQKSRQFPLRFYIQKAINFTFRDSSWNFWSWHLYTKSMTLCVTWCFYIQKARHFAKSNTICDTFLYTKILHFAFRDFSLNFCNLRRGGDLFKKCTLRDIFILKKRGTLRYVAIYKEPDTMRYILISKKKYTFLYVYRYIDVYVII